MVVIGIIGILSSIAVPFFKKVYEDYQVNKTYAITDTIISCQRAYYLVMNEPASNSGSASEITKQQTYFMPGNLFRPFKGTKGYPVAVAPYKFLHWLGLSGMTVSYYIDSREGLPFYYQELKARYEKKGFRVSYTETVSGAPLYVTIDFPERSQMGCYY